MSSRWRDFWQRGKKSQLNLLFPESNKAHPPGLENVSIVLSCLHTIGIDEAAL